MTDIDSGRPEPGDSDRDENPTAPDGPDPTSGFKLTPIPDGLLQSAVDRVREVLAGKTAVGDLKMYYDTGSDYAGRTFLGVPPLVEDQFTAADLFAVSLLQVSVRPGAARSFLDPGPERDRLNSLLTALRAHVELADAGGSTYSAMAQLYTKVKTTLGSDPWVTASKICARKRPRLFPVRDKRVRMLLDLYRHRDYTIDWQVFSHVMRQRDVVDRLAEFEKEAEGGWDGRVSLDAYPLRHLDVLLWMEARRKGVGGAIK